MTENNNINNKNTEDLHQDIRFTGISNILLDIEGTTCPVSYVSKVLFPYASHHLGEFLECHAHDDPVECLLAEVETAWQQDKNQEACALRATSNRSIVAYLQLLIRQDRKLPALKELQGMIWKEGYAKGDLIVELYEDVPDTLRRWHGAGLSLAVYSSGSIGAQQLLYGHTNVGDLSRLFSGWFDTRVGPKKEAESYRKITSFLNVQPHNILFISDSEQEIIAAKAAGIHTLLCNRKEDFHSWPERCEDCMVRSSDLASIRIIPLVHKNANEDTKLNQGI
jgi:enolase-phosphatase E1